MNKGYGGEGDDKCLDAVEESLRVYSAERFEALGWRDPRVEWTACLTLRVGLTDGVMERWARSRFFVAEVGVGTLMGGSVRRTGGRT